MPEQKQIWCIQRKRKKQGMRIAGFSTLEILTNS